MNKDKLNQLIDDFDPDEFKKTVDAIGKMSEVEFARAQMRVEDKKTFEEVGVERITLFILHGESILLIKPIKGMYEGWQLNMRYSGSLNLSANPKLSILDIAGDYFRFRIEDGSVNYWVDLIDERQAQDLATFLGIGIGTEV